MKWVTWKNVGVDRMGCAWLILSRIDPQATFTFVERGAPIPEDAEPFDIPGVRFSHHAGHCSFCAFIDHFQLSDPILHRIARIIDEADTVQSVNVEPIAPGLDAVCEGLQLLCGDDWKAIVSGCQIYDALYARLAAEESKLPALQS